ncbi:type II secretory ATPase GspE/PulE/Tfp pilus assembly ATPase PilB-like protein [Longimicrobium terrae]|uniref:Type II secretory ATPase GspE/PulE/Tfp pilus assembly ATPase PilB-like protein n=2 Tax=Longimicrobium terrae TaxID=1639882 RepID=A0A841H316_9BACT|nr:type II secretory ATPase GspE/PulE/Tfp pilus assembly ATPase PilB-like protein [Longimicrobium terrae]MBB6072394.1 type II secretory ATPase GspE/PulE/Tfp pilus assembly ATPase PilB-like protein [Longimicrobium terrae]
MSADVSLAEGISRDFLLHHRLCPREVSPEGVLVVAAADNALTDAADDLAWAYGREVRLERASAAEVEQMIERLATRSDRLIELAQVNPDGDDLAADVRDLANQPPVIRYVNLLVRDAYDAGASDIHLEAERSGLTARFRLDGVLAPAPEAPAELHHAIVSRIKLLAELDISERRRPQDGRIRVRLESRELDLRVSTVPTMFGESVVLRLLDRGGRPVALGELGMPANVRIGMEALARKPHGMILVTGPTGSGKTTTLYAALGLRDTRGEKVITVEDPVEYQLPGVAQVPVHRQAGVTFGAALRSILRQDPDVIMVGEMRDPETAEIAVQAAMTGHLVFSTLHTNDAVSALARLLDLGIPDYLVAATLDGILAQRLVRRVCDRCLETYDPPRDAVRRLAGDDDTLPAAFVRGTGCPACRGTGYRGRTGVYELLVMDDVLREGVIRRAPRAEMREAARRAGMTPMRADGWARVKDGITTVEEVLRVVQE